MWGWATSFQHPQGFSSGEKCEEEKKYQTNGVSAAVVEVYPLTAL